MRKSNRIIQLESPPLGESKEPQISDFEKQDCLGGGTFGTVYKVVHRQTGNLYAMKEIKKSHITQSRRQEAANRELEIHYQANHEYIMKLFTHFEDEENIYLILELLIDGNLYDLLQKQGRLSEHEVVKYMRQVVEAIKYLHSLPTPVLHRDIKPENIMLNCKGEVRLGDFGSANSVQNQSKRYTFEGTKIYMAPEIFESQGYDQCVDIWSLGVLIFELLTGRTPFLEEDSNVQDSMLGSRLVKNIKSGYISFPQDYPALARDLTRKMLKIDPSQRLTLREILDHPWMKQDIVIQANEDITQKIDEKEYIQQQLRAFREENLNRSQFNQLRDKLQEIKQQINTYQIEICKTQIENQKLEEKLEKIKKANDDTKYQSQIEDEETDAEAGQIDSQITPAKIIQVQNKYNKLNQNLMKLQQEILEKETEIAKHSFQQDLKVQLEKKIKRETETVEKLEIELLSLDAQKRREQQEFQSLFNEFTTLNENRSLSLKKRPNVTYQNKSESVILMRQIIDNLKQIVDRHKDMIDNPLQLGDQEEEEDFELENLEEDCLDEMINQLQAEFDKKKLQMKYELARQTKEIQILEEQSQKFQSEANQVTAREDLIRKGESILKNQEFAYRIKFEQVKKLKEEKTLNQQKLTKLQDDFNEKKRKQPLP